MHVATIAGWPKVRLSSQTQTRKRPVWPYPDKLSFLESFVDSHSTDTP